jgi:hypothetical protein
MALAMFIKTWFQELGRSFGKIILYKWKTERSTLSFLYHTIFASCGVSIPASLK